MKKQTLFFRWSAGLLLLATSLSACYGPFTLTKDLHRWNGRLGRSVAASAPAKSRAQQAKWTNEAVFVAFVFIPVYEVAMMADAIVLNSIHFWTGQDTLAGASAKKSGGKS
jgi:hypothetical protein